MDTKNYDFLVIGAGIFGITTAIELSKRKYKVAILNPDQIPHPLAASTDISKVVRMEYGTDQEYMDMAEESIAGWHTWNEQFNDTLYHEVGFLLTCRQGMDSQGQSFESASYQNLLRKGYRPDRLNATIISKRYPAYRADTYSDGFYHKKAGFVESGRAITTLTNFARSLGVDIFEEQTAEELVQEGGQIIAVKTREGQRFSCGHAVVCAGNFTPYLVPALKPYMKVTGHPVFHLKPSQPELFLPSQFPVFAADISNTGWYGFPLHPKKGVVKIAHHGIGLELHPEFDERVVTKEDETHLRQFLRTTFPSLEKDPIVYTRRCCYTDTLDGHFWIDQHPSIKGLTIGSGGSGHGMKMGPVIGNMIATTAEGGTHKWSTRYRWRELNEHTVQTEEARFINQNN